MKDHKAPIMVWKYKSSPTLKNAKQVLMKSVNEPFVLF